MIHVHVEAVKSINSVVDVIHKKSVSRKAYVFLINVIIKLKGGERCGRTRPNETRVTNI